MSATAGSLTDSWALPVIGREGGWAGTDGSARIRDMLTGCGDIVWSRIYTGSLLKLAARITGLFWIKTKTALTVWINPEQKFHVHVQCRSDSFLHTRGYF